MVNCKHIFFFFLLTLNGVDEANVTWARYQESRGPDWAESCQISRSIAESFDLDVLKADFCKTLRPRLSIKNRFANVT